MLLNLYKSGVTFVQEIVQKFRANTENISENLINFFEELNFIIENTKVAVDLWQSEDFIKVIKTMKEVEHSSETAFEKLYTSFVNHRK